MPEPLEEIAARITRLTLNTNKVVGGSGPVLSIVRDTTSGKIYVGLNTGTPGDAADVLQQSIAAQKTRVAQGEVIVVRSDPLAINGGHSEVNALNRAITAREKVLKRKLNEQELRGFELHNVWLKGDRAGTPAARCEHCARITRGVSVTQSLFVAEGGVVGEVRVPQRGAVKPAGSRDSKPVTTASGTISPNPGGGSSRGGSGVGPSMVGLLTGLGLLTAPLVKSWIAKNYLQEKWAAEERAMVEKAIEQSLLKFNVLILSRLSDIKKEKAAGRQVRLHVQVDTDYVQTEYGPAQTAAEVSYFYVLFAGEAPGDWPLFQPKQGFFEALLNAPKLSRRRASYEFVL